MRCEMARRGSVGAVLALGVLGGGVLLTAPGQALASTVTLTVVPATGTGLIQGDVCSTTDGQTCPTDPTFAMTGTYPVSGDFQYNSTAGTASFSLMLTQNATFGTQTLDSGSTFSGAGVTVSSSSLGGGETEISMTGGPFYGTQSLTFSGAAGLTQTSGGGAPSISALNCIIGAPTDTCTLQLGPSGTGLQDSSSNPYDSFLRFSVNASAVPLPPALWSFAGGLLLLLAGVRLQRSGVLARA